MPVALYVIIVAPFVGAWIEICIYKINCRRRQVAPFVGAWIEIYTKVTKVTRKS